MPVSILRSPPSSVSLSEMSVPGFRLISAVLIVVFLRKAHRDGVCVRVQVLALRERDNILCVAFKRVPRVLDHAGFSFKNVSVDSGEKNLAVPEVGRT